MTIQAKQMQGAYIKHIGGSDEIQYKEAKIMSLLQCFAAKR